jgi:hypothetical protein
MDPKSLKSLSDQELFRTYGIVMEELRGRGLTRSSNNPVADYAELLVANHFGVEPVQGVQAGYDVLTNDGVRIQVKARRRAARSQPRYYGWIRNLDAREFDMLALVLFGADFEVIDADLLDWDAITKFARYNERVGAHRLPIVTPRMREHSGVSPFQLPLP